MIVFPNFLVISDRGRNINEENKCSIFIMKNRYSKLNHNSSENFKRLSDRRYYAIGQNIFFSTNTSLIYHDDIGSDE